ncbi:hypothetical protein GCM10007862_07340 [Dyella lipolytica]|uniref:Uncharacterized protein n=1 Tax=Dyella lipolytica TaxID=1867835 RepID=A0ABW8IZS2_9GAMM|nr:hypothetical protein [Dyella lipolytica]GLQ45683.1 hypothetical protein GCM10007862_07340 [Dyella lipolytica]
MGPEITEHREVQIRYGYSIRDDLFYAHFDLPTKQQSRGFQRSVQMHMSPGISPGKDKVSASTEQEVLTKARTRIDQYFNE